VQHSLFLMLQASDILITAQTKAVDPELGAVIALLASVIDKRKCQTCSGLGYLRDLTPCPKCHPSATESIRRDTIRA
jgi:hypothetical protein